MDKDFSYETIRKEPGLEQPVIDPVMLFAGLASGLGRAGLGAARKTMLPKLRNVLAGQQRISPHIVEELPIKASVRTRLGHLGRYAPESRKVEVTFTEPRTGSIGKIRLSKDPRSPYAFVPEEVKVPKQFQKQGIGSKIFLRMVETAEASGKAGIKTAFTPEGQRMAESLVRRGLIQMIPQEGKNFLVKTAR